MLEDPEAAVLSAANSLADTYPLLSARAGLLSAQKYLFGVLCAGAVLLALAAPQLAPRVFGGAALLLFASLLLWKLLLLLASLKAGPTPSTADTDKTPPTYTVLIALYQEEGAIAGLAEAMRALDWPDGKLDLKLLLEAGDTETLRAVKDATWPTGAEYIVLPPGLPQTKPRALNVGLQRARGKFVTIYDAEDRPQPDQLQAAWATFRAADQTLACLQAPLVAYNDQASWIAGQWALEYRQQFGIFVPALAHLGMPIPLGGTSNHFRYDALMALGGWDAWNVTEDADLGMRLAQAGYRTGTISPPTLEEAPESFSVWSAQRSRWIKGFAQTWMVLNRAPIKVASRMGWPRFVAAQLLLSGTVLSACLHAPLMAACIIALLTPALSIPPLAILLLLATALTHLSIALFAPGARGPHRFYLIATLFLYWPLHSIAALRALRELIIAPHLWAKTPHGLTKCQPVLTPAQNPA